MAVLKSAGGHSAVWGLQGHCKSLYMVAIRNCVGPHGVSEGVGHNLTGDRAC